MTRATISGRHAPGTGKANVVLLGMAGAGKSTLAPLLAAELGWRALDTDVLMEQKAGMPLQALLDTQGDEGFGQMEEAVALALRTRGAVIATGGSMIYRERAVAHLRAMAVTVFLDVPLSRLMRRPLALDRRGLVDRSGLGFAALHRERRPRYQAAADLSCLCGAHAPGETARFLAALLRRRYPWIRRRPLDRT